MATHPDSDLGSAAMALRHTVADPCFPDLFEQTARRLPDRPALICGDTRLTYLELNRRANQLAHRLRALGITQGTCVALCLPRSADMIVALLGILKSGGAYVPLLPDSPRPRLAHQLEETEAPVIVTVSSLLGTLPGTASPLCLDQHLPAEDAHLSDPSRLARPSSACYVIYTSGSTGTPKGVAVRHENLLNYITYMSQLLQLDQHDAAGGLSFATVSTLAADLGNTCIFPALASGGCLHIITHAIATDGRLFGQYARRNRIDVLKITPSHLSALLAVGGGDVLPRRYLLTGGEAASWTLVDRVRSLSRVRWINHYGPTETTIGSLTLDLDAEEHEVRHTASVVPIGRPIANTRVYILDREQRPVLPGDIGELYIGGAGVAAGYLKQPARTAERFLQEPGVTGGRMYRTGDRVRALPGGAIEFLGRMDDQVKVRGHRVELTEIETVLHRHPSVGNAVVAARDFRPLGVRLAAYVVPTPGHSPSIPSLREHLRATLPEYMVPSAFAILPELPLTSNGKVDRNALPYPTALDSSSGQLTTARAVEHNGLESTIMSIWKELLNLRHVPLNESFFDLGGDSLAALDMLAMVHARLGTMVPSQVLFDTPTVAALATYLRAGTRRDFRSLVAIQHNGRRPPLLCIHGGGGEVYWCRHLARRLGSDQPLYALQVRRESDGKVLTRRVEQMAHYYLEEIRRAFPGGPYYLAGASFGGKVAFEMAHMLRAQGEHVALLAMFDTWGPGYPQPRRDIGRIRRAVGWFCQRAGHHLGSVWLLDRTERIPYLRDKLNRAWLESKWALEDLAKERRRRRAEVRGHHVGALAVPSSYIKEASAHYVARPYPGRVALFRSMSQPYDAVPDRTLGWSSVVQDLEVYDVPGIHAAMIAEPRVRYLVAKLAPVLEMAQRAGSTSPRASHPAAESHAGDHG